MKKLNPSPPYDTINLSLLTQQYWNFNPKYMCEINPYGYNKLGENTFAENTILPGEKNEVKCRVGIPEEGGKTLNWFNKLFTENH